MTVLMKLEGGPLDGEQQIVEMLPNTTGARLLFNIPNFQTFDPTSGTEAVTGLGLQAYYVFVGPGPGPGTGDSWATSWIYSFTGESFVPTPGPKPPPGPQVMPAYVFMSATTTLVPDSLPIMTSPSVELVAESDIEVDALVTPFQYGVVAMSGETSMSVVPDWTPQVTMSAQTAMEIDAFLVLTPSSVMMSDNTTEMVVGAVSAGVRLSAGTTMTVTGVDTPVGPAGVVAVGGPDWGNSGSTASLFGQPTTAGNNLIALVQADGTTNISCSDGTWTQAIQIPSLGGNGRVAIFYKRNCGASEAPPNFTSAARIGVVLIEASGCSITAPLQHTASTAVGNGATTMTATASAADASTGSLVVASAGFINCNAPPVSSRTLNSGSAVAMTLISHNNGGNTNSEWDFSYGISTANSSPDSVTINFTNGLQDEFLVIASFH
jgi:hypothetical protein